MFTSLTPSSFSIKIHWTLVLGIGWLLAHSNRVVDLLIPSWAVLALVAGALGLLLVAALVVRLLARRFEMQTVEWIMGPSGLFLPSETHSLPRRARVWLAISTPAVYLAVGLVTLPFLINAGGLQGLLAAWDWWSWSSIAARLSLLALVLAAVQLLPFYPLSGAHLLQALVGNRRLAFRLSQILALAAGALFWDVPLVLPFTVYCVLRTEAEVRRTFPNEKSDPFVARLLPS